MLNRVLLVDDSKSARFALRKLLERTGMQVDVAESAEQALGYLDSNHPDLIFMDHFMPGMDGFEAARAIKNRPERSEIPIVMCTSKEDEDYHQQARANGAVDILTKPATPTALNKVLYKLAKNIEQQQAENASMVDAGVIEDQPTPPESPVVPTLDDIVVPVDEIRKVASESAAAVVNGLMEQHLNELFQAKVPELREQVLANFDTVVKSMLQGYMQQAIQQAKEEFKSLTESSSREMANQVCRDEMDSALQVKVQQLQEQSQRDLNEQLAEIYSNIGDLKSNQNLKKVAPELMDDILMRAREVASEEAKEALGKAEEMAQQTSREVADEVSQRSNAELIEKLDSRFSKGIDNGVQVARQEAAEVAWKKSEELGSALNSRLSKLAIMAGVSMVSSVVALLGVAYFLV